MICLLETAREFSVALVNLNPQTSTRPPNTFQSILSFSFFLVSVAVAFHHDAPNAGHQRRASTHCNFTKSFHAKQTIAARVHDVCGTRPAELATS
jgi:hypothetical protein